jgi:L-ascorbate metabolism protein UlaG (beta-lactamase superfamily)
MPQNQPSHHTERGFRNPPGSPEQRATAADYWRFVWRRILQRQHAPTVPEGHVLKPAEAAAGLIRHAEGPSLTWLGHAAFLLRIGGKAILLDPYLGDFASPLDGFGPKRFVPPAFTPAELPPIDALIVSHNHYDHLCAATLRALPGKDRLQVIVPLGLAPFFHRLGYGRVAELDWHGRFELDGLTITALPAVHWSKRGLFDRNRTLWASFALSTARHRVWFAGDTGYDPVFAELGRDYGPFDLALIPIAAYAPRAIMAAHHATPEEAVRIGREMRADTLVAIHWGTVILTDEPPFEPPVRFRAAAAAAGYDEDHAWLMRIGETRPLVPRWPANT